MREKTFRRPTAREILEINSINVPEKIKERDILKLINEGVLVLVRSYKDSIGIVENLGENRIALFPSNFRVSKQESDYGIKSLEGLVKIDSQKVLRGVSKTGEASLSLTKGFAQVNEIWPYTLIRESIKYADIENPPMGFYWLGTDGRFRATTWIRSATGAEMQVMKSSGDFKGEVIDKKPYGRNFRVRVQSRTEEGKVYEYTLARLPMHKKGDIRQFSDWINISHNSSDPDASYRGEEHEKRVAPICFWSASTIFSFYDAMVFVRKNPEWKQFRINPFPIPVDENMINYIDNLRLQSLILEETEQGLRLESLDKTEIDKSLGARTILRGYDNCWYHWDKRDLSFLYRPKRLSL